MNWVHITELPVFLCCQYIFFEPYTHINSLCNSDDWYLGLGMSLQVLVQHRLISSSLQLQDLMQCFLIALIKWLQARKWQKCILQAKRRQLFPVLLLTYCVLSWSCALQSSDNFEFSCQTTAKSPLLCLTTRVGNTVIRKYMWGTKKVWGSASKNGAMS